MTTSELLEGLRREARSNETLRRSLLQTKQASDPLREFCDLAAEAGFPISPIELVVYGEEAYAAMRRSTNGGGENSPMLEGEDDYYELLLAELTGL